MKDEIIAGVIGVLFIALFAYNSHVMESRTKSLADCIDEVEADVNSDAKDIEKICSKWQKDKSVLMYLTSHENILKVDECVEMAKECLESGQSHRAMHLLKLARNHIEDLREREKISLDNIF